MKSVFIVFNQANPQPFQKLHRKLSISVFQLLQYTIEFSSYMIIQH